MTALQAVCLGVAVGVFAGFGLIVAGVAIIAGLAWALITGGILLALGVTGAGVALLSERGGKEAE